MSQGSRQRRFRRAVVHYRQKFYSVTWWPHGLSEVKRWEPKPRATPKWHWVRVARVSLGLKKAIEAARLAAKE